MANIRLEKLTEMLNKQPNDAFLHYAVAMEHLGLNNPNLAQEWFSKVLALEPKNIATHYQLGMLLHQKGDEKGAITLLEKGEALARANGDLKTANEFKTAIEEIIY